MLNHPFMKLAGLLCLLVLTSAASAQAQWPERLLASLKTDQQKADTLMALAMKQFSRSKFDSTSFYVQKGLPFAERTGNSELIAYYLLTQGNVYTYTGQLQQSLQALRKAKAFVDRAAVYPLELKYYLFTALTYERLHANDSALGYLHTAEELNNRNDPYKNWMVYNQVGIMFHNAEDYTEADKYFSKAYALTRAKGNRVDYGITLYRYASMVYDWGKTELFARLMEEQQRFAQSSRIDVSIDPVHRVMFVDWSKKSFQERVAFMQNVKADFQKRNMRSNVINANLYLADFYLQEKKYDQALSFMEENRAMLQNETDVIAIYTNEKMLYRLLKLSGRNSEALVVADRLFALKDSLARLQKRDVMLELQTKYQTDQKEKDIALLNAENKLSSLRLAKEMELKLALERENVLKDSAVIREQKLNELLGHENELRTTQLRNEQTVKNAVSRENALNAERLVKEKKLRGELLLLAMLLLLSGALIFYLYRKQRKKNLLIQKQSDELEVLMKEIHHRVKNNLQIISSLLDLQSLSMQDKQASEAVKESKNRVLSMALIHQNLYTEGNIKGIHIQEYITNLVNALFDSYNIQKEQISLVTDIDHLNLDVDTVIPLGLIINELVSNSLKYGFVGRENGELRVELKQYEKELRLLVRDNGVGFSNGWTQKSGSFGFKLLRAFTQKLRAKLEVYNDGGACVRMSILRYKLAPDFYPANEGPKTGETVITALKTREGIESPP